MTSAPPTPSSALVLAAIDSIQQSLSELCPNKDHQPRFYFDNPRRFCSFASRLQFILQQLLRSSPSPESLPAAALTALKGISADLSVAADAASLYSKRSKIFVLVNCRSLCDSLQERTSAIANWLALLDSDLPDLRKKIADLSRDMKQTQFTVIFSLSFSRLLALICLPRLLILILILAGNGERGESALYATERGTRKTNKQSSTKRHNHGLSASSRD